MHLSTYSWSLLLLLRFKNRYYYYYVPFFWRVSPLKITIQKQQLNESIQDVSKAISSRTTIPILTGIKIEANSAGVTLTASDTDISIQAFIPAEIDGERIIDIIRSGSVVVPAKFFVDIIR